MTKKNLFWLTLTLFLTALLVFTGCPTGSGTDTSTTQQPETGSSGGGPTTTYRPPKTLSVDGSTTTADVNQELNKFTTQTLTLSNSTGSPIEVDIGTGESLTVPPGKTLQIGDDVTLKVESGGTAAITGTVNVASGGSVDFSEILPAQTSNPITVSGTVTVASGGTLLMPASDPVNPNFTPQFQYGPSGKIVVQQGSTVCLNMTGSPYGNINITQIGAPLQSPGDYSDPTKITEIPIFEWSGSGGSVEFVQGNILTLASGTLICKGGPSPDGSGGVNRSEVSVQNVVIAQGAELVLKERLKIVDSLELNGTLDLSDTETPLEPYKQRWPLISTIVNATLIIGPNAEIKFNNTSPLAEQQKAIFRDTFDNAQSSPPIPTPGTYKWVATIVSGVTITSGGWVLQP